MTESDVYRAALKRTQHHHATQNKTFSGQFTWKRRKKIKDIIDQRDCHSILDFGCGKCKQYDPAVNRDDEGRSLEEFWGIKPYRYDPGVPAYSTKPVGKFDLVICVQVLCAIPKRDLPWVIDELYSYADKALFVSERLGNPHKPIYNDIADEMPRYTAEEWIQLLRRPGSPIRLTIAFRNTIAPMKKYFEPDDQG